MEKWSLLGNKKAFATTLGRFDIPTVEIYFFSNYSYMAQTGLAGGSISGSIRGLVHRLVNELMSCYNQLGLMVKILMPMQFHTYTNLP